MYRSLPRAGEKPHGPEVAKFQLIGNYVREDCTIAQFAAYVAHGHAWRAGIYRAGAPSVEKVHVETVQVIALDFDKTSSTPEEVYEYARSIGFDPTLWYYSYSQGDKSGSNFRVVWVLEKMITPEQYERAYEILLDVFARFSIDSSTKDASRLWFGTNKEVNILCHHPVPLSKLGCLLVQERCKQERKPDRSQTPQKLLEDIYYDLEVPDVVYVTRDWIDQLRPYCDLLDRWCRGEYLTYNQRFVLFSNLKFLRYRDKKRSVVNDIITFYRADVYEEHTCNPYQIRRMMRDRKAVPIPIVDEGTKRITAPEFFNRERSVPTSTIKISRKELDDLLDERIPKLLADPGFTYIVSQTACGKTERIIHCIAEPPYDDKKIFVCFPRYDLIDEFEQRFRATSNRPIYKIPCGEYREKDYLLMELGFPPQSAQGERYSAIQKMLHPDSKGIFLCTHKLLSHVKELHADLIIIDENIEDALTDVVELPIAGLSGLLYSFNNEDDSKAALDFIEAVKRTEAQQYISIEPLVDAMRNSFSWDNYIGVGTPVAGVAKIFDAGPTARVVERRKGKAIRFCLTSRLFRQARQKQIPVKLFSATPQSTRLELMLGERIHEVEFPLAINAGRITQFLGISGAKGKSNDGNAQEAMAFVRAKLPEEIISSSFVLTYKSWTDIWKAAGFNIPEVNGHNIHLQNCSGLDFLKGKSIIVVGKPDWNDFDYINLFYDHFPATTPKPKKQNRVVTINGKPRKMYLWDNECLRNIQLEIIGKDLNQAVGRARALRESDARVYVFANYPVQDADEYYS